MSLPCHENLDLLIVGDSKVGKSTLINCYLTRRFSFVPSGVLKSKIEIPGTEYGCKSVNIHLCDSHKWNENLEKSILSSSAILIVGSWDNPQSINRIENYWIPSVAKLCEAQSIPIIILINKSDMLGGLDNVDYMNQEYRSTLCNALQQHHMIKHVFQTSCIEIKSVTTAFDVAIQRILYPIQSLIISTDDYVFKSIQKHASYPYYKAISQVKRKLHNESNPTQLITEKFLLALTRIFHILDRDNNALLTDDEILYYYRNCLTLNSMKLSQLQRLKQWLLSVSESEQKEIDYYSYLSHHQTIQICYVHRDGITFAGFVQLHLVLVQMLQHDMIWKSLEKFGYKRRDLGIDPKVYPTVPNKTDAAQYCGIHNAILRGQMHDLISKTSKCRIQYELAPTIAGFLMSIFIDFCENKHDEYENKYIHEYSTCFISRNGMNKLLQKYNIDTFPFADDDLELVGVELKDGAITLTAWLSLWSLMMCYDTDVALQYLVTMGAPTIFPSHDFTPKWTDYIVPQVTASGNTHQRFYNTLIVTYPYNETLIQQFVRSSVNDFNSATARVDDDVSVAPTQYVTPKRPNRRQSKISAASRTGSLSPIVEAAKETPFVLDTHNYQSYMYTHEDDHKYSNDDDVKQDTETKDSIQRLNTVLLMKPRDRRSNYKYYSYGMLTDTQKSEYIYNQHHSFLFKETGNKRKPLIELNLLNKDLGVDAYHILHESWPPHVSDEDGVRSGQDQLFEMDTKHGDNDGECVYDKKVEKHLRTYDAVIYLHTTHALGCSENVKRLYNICRDIQMAIITVHLPFEVHTKDEIETVALNEDSMSIITRIGTPRERERQLRREQSMQQLLHILDVYDLPHRLLRWESFAEDQLRFSHDLIERLHFGARNVPKTIWQKRKINAIRYTKKASMYAVGIGLMCYLTPMRSVSKYLKLPTTKAKGNPMNHSNNNESKAVIRKKRDKKRRKRKQNTDRWKSLIAIAVVTSVFYGGYYIYDVYGKYNKSHRDSDDEEEEDDDCEETMLSCVVSYLYPKLYDDDAYAEEYNDDDLSLTSFGFLTRKK